MAIINQHSAFKKKSGIQKTPINSSAFLQFFQYDPEAQQLTVVLKTGGQYVYDNVDSAIVDQFVQAPSKGQFYAKYIKGKFESTRLIDKTVGPEEGKHGHSSNRNTAVRKDHRTNQPGKPGRSHYNY